MRPLWLRRLKPLRPSNRSLLNVQLLKLSLRQHQFKPLRRPPQPSKWRLRMRLLRPLLLSRFA